MCHLRMRLLDRIKKSAKKFPFTQRKFQEKSSSHEKKVISWFKDNGDLTLRLNYDLNESSLVLDIGGYRGQWASDIYSLYKCKIMVFEPVSAHANFISERFSNNPNIMVFPFGLADKTIECYISVCQDGSSIFITDNANKEKILLRKATEFFYENSISHIDLIKINIEGGEYDLLEHLINSNFIRIIDNIQVQFHDNVPNASNRMSNIQKKLSETHFLTYQYPFVWENWRIKNDDI